MLYFIPSWHQPDSWMETEQPWYIRRQHSEYDDTVKQVQLFHRSGAYPCRILLLSYAPNFRHFLHRQSVYHAGYWSCFDAICEIEKKWPSVFSYHDIDWPDGVEFIYTPFAICAMRNGRKYAQLEFGEDGNLIRIDMADENTARRRNYYDDRGFVGCTVVYDGKGTELYRDYLTENGMRKMRLVASDGHVEINPDCPCYRLEYDGNVQTIEFNQTEYPNMEAVISEVFTSYASLMKWDAVFCIAADNFTAGLLERSLRGEKKILSFFEDRCGNTISESLRRLIADSQYIVTDSEENRRRLRKAGVGKEKKIRDITPYDSRVDMGRSQQIHVQKILVPVDGITERHYRRLIRNLAAYLTENDRAQVCLFTRSAEFGIGSRLLNLTRTVLSDMGYDPEWARDAAKEEEGNNNPVDASGETPARFFVEQCVDELAVSRCVREQRVVVDVRPEAELYLQICALSAGIPQIVMADTRYVEDGRNGAVIARIAEVTEYLHKYLDSLKEWNEAKVESYEISRQFTSGVLMEMWKEVIEEIG